MYIGPFLVSDPLVQCTWFCPALIVRVVVDCLLLFGSFFCSSSSVSSSSESSSLSSGDRLSGASASGLHLMCT